MKSFKNNLIMVDISNMGDESLDICRDIEKKKIQVLVTFQCTDGVDSVY
ncbi:MAG: hypothetical protein ACLVB1_04440 [Blautia obeum]